MSEIEMKEMLEKQLRLLSKQSLEGCEDGEAVAKMSEQMVNVSKFLLSITPADEKRLKSPLSAMASAFRSTIHGTDEAAK